jgi:hypothetical protein
MFGPCAGAKATTSTLGHDTHKVAAAPALRQNVTFTPRHPGR